MEGLRIVVQPSGAPQIEQQLTRAAQKLSKPARAAQMAAIWMAGETFRIFSAGYNVNGPWEGLSKVTLFLRRHRANSPRQGTEPGSDTGRLKGSFVPEWSDDGTMFGAGTNVDYAQDFNDGGPSKANIVAIAGFNRMLGGHRNLQGADYASGKVRKLSHYKTQKVRDYLMRMKDGNPVPPRQFFPDGMPELRSWGYVDKIREIFALDIGEALGGSA